MGIAGWLKEARQQAGLTQEQLAERIGRTKLSISRWERGERGIGAEDMLRISEVTGHPMPTPSAAGGDANQPPREIPSTHGNIPQEDPPALYRLDLPDRKHSVSVDAARMADYEEWLRLRGVSRTLALAASLGIPLDWLIPPDPSIPPSSPARAELSALLAAMKAQDPDASIEIEGAALDTLSEAEVAEALRQAKDALRSILKRLPENSTD